MLGAGGFGKIDVQPNPAPEGGTANLTYHGEGELYYYDFGDPQSGWKELPLDPETGEGQIQVPVGSPGIALSNRDWDNPVETFLEVQSTRA